VSVQLGWVVSFLYQKVKHKKRGVAIGANACADRMKKRHSRADITDAEENAASRAAFVSQAISA
jgi:hypothetical protein